MSKSRRKSDTCLNCNHSLGPEDNYCPNCGQENNTNKISAHHLAFEAFEDFFHFDSKLWHTLKASFSQPGRITLDYLAGKRMRYVPPVKLYIFVSFIFFLLLGKLSDHAIDSGKNGIIGNKHGDMSSMSITMNELLGKDKVYHSDDNNDVGLIEFDFYSKDSLMTQLRSLRSAPDSALNSILEDEDIDTTAACRAKLRSALALIPKSSLKLDTIKAQYGIYNKVKFNSKEDYDKFKANINYYTDSQVDSLLKSKGEKASWFNRQMVRKVGKFDSHNPDHIKQLTHAALKSISLTMFIMMPLTAILLLFIFYRKKYYYEHLIFSIHIHTIFFIIFSVILAVQVFISESFGEKLWGWSLLGCLIYLIASLKHNYKQSWGRTVGKFLLMSIPYLIVSITLVVLAVMFGFLA